jgi:hypothetical protein
MRRRTTALDGTAALIILLLMVQVWLLSATLDAYLAGHTDAALPGAVCSGIIFAATAGLYWSVQHIDRGQYKPKGDINRDLNRCSAALRVMR